MTRRPVVAFVDREPWEGFLQFAAALRARGVRVERLTGADRSAVRRFNDLLQRPVFARIRPVVPAGVEGASLADAVLAALPADVRVVEAVDEIAAALATAARSPLPPRTGAADREALLFDKLALTRHAAAAGLDVPRSMPAEDDHGLVPPFVVKPRLGAGGVGVSVIRDAAAAAVAAARARREAGVWLAQEWAPGELLHVGGVARDGVLLQAACFRAVGSPNAAFGPSSEVVTVDDPAALEQVRRLLAGLRYTGAFCTDHVRDAGGRALLVDLNARIFGSWAAFQAAGLDLVSAWLYAHGLTGQPPTGAVRPGVRLRIPPPDMSPAGALTAALRDVRQLAGALGPRWVVSTAGRLLCAAVVRAGRRLTGRGAPPSTPERKGGMSLTVTPITAEEHRGFLAGRAASYLQCPTWAAVKRDWLPEHLGWRDATGELVGAALVLHRRLPLVRRSLAFVTEGPVLDWADHPLEDVVDPLVAHVRAQGAVTLRMGPDLVLHRWSAATVKAAVGPGQRLADVPPDETAPVAERLEKELTAHGWARPRDGVVAYGSTRHAFHVELSGRTPDDVFAGMNQQWRRSIRKAEKAGVTVARGGFDDLADFHRVYVDTARRDGFPPHPLEYFQRAWTALSAEAPDRIRLYLGRHEGEVLAGMLVVTVGGLAGYAYGGSASHRRDVAPSGAVHWRILQDLVEEGRDVYDMRGVGDTLDPDEPKFGMLRFKLGTGGDAVENLGDWDLPVRPGLHRLVMVALAVLARAARLRSRRGAGSP